MRVHVLAALVVFFATFPALAATNEFTAEQAATATIEELLNIQVTTVAGVEQDWFRSPAALTVVTGEDLRRSGHHTLADVLRIVPGVFVGQRGSSEWTIGMRGFNAALANKTLVLIDGRRVYDPLFGGTFWDVQDILLADLERIEVIRGPGATLWGANAVNGVINVITKNTRDTQGIYASAGGGSEEHGFVNARYGGRVSDKLTYKVWGKYFERDHYSTATGSAHDSWDLGHGGIRLDYDDGENTRWMFDADVYNLGRIGELVGVPIPGQHLQFTPLITTGWANGGHALAQVQQTLSEDSEWQLRAYYDRTNRSIEGGLHLERDTGEVDFRHRFELGGRNVIQWGLNERFSADRVRSSATTTYRLDPGSRNFNSISGFVQSTTTLVPDRLFAMVGTKLEYNTFSGFEVQPGVRMWWTPDDRNMLWAAISRPVRVPSRLEQDGDVTFGYADPGLLGGGPPAGEIVRLHVSGDPDARSEKLVAYELGYRRRVTDDLTLDITPFYNDYKRLLYLPTTLFGTFTDEGSGETYGVEVAATWRPFENWKIEASYSYVDVQIHDLFPHDEGNMPHHQVKALSFVDLTDWLEWNTGLYYVDEMPTEDVPSYVRLDQGLTWRATKNVSLSIWGQNLLEDTHREANRNIRVERAFYVEVTLRLP